MPALPEIAGTAIGERLLSDGATLTLISPTKVAGATLISPTKVVWAHRLI
ncbi:hypothetical protein LTSEBAI_1257 [Salmonella enterica subsp. enterica serovar Baildon str. R6-199]|nr:hypothetical protein LTSEBAI_1257 [Salmonella enterica subsp. enterica serovar Baildon str. R6-199]